MLSRAAEMRLRAVATCEVLRGRFADPGLMELERRALVYSRFVDPVRCDYRLTAHGREVAFRLPKIGVLPT